MWLCQDVQPFFSIYSRNLKETVCECLCLWSVFLPTLLLPPLLFLSLLFVSDCHSTFMTGLWCVPKTNGARQDGHCCPGNRVESRRREWEMFFPPFSFPFWLDVQVRGERWRLWEKGSSDTRREAKACARNRYPYTLTSWFWSKDSFTLFIGYLTETPSLWASGTVRASVCCCVCV